MKLSFKFVNQFAELINKYIQYEEEVEVEFFIAERNQLIEAFNNLRTEIDFCLININDEPRRNFYLEKITTKVKFISFFSSTDLRAECDYHICSRWSGKHEFNKNLVTNLGEDFSKYESESRKGIVPQEIIFSCYWWLYRFAIVYIEHKKKYFTTQKSDNDLIQEESNSIIKWNGSLKELAEVFYILAKKGKINLAEVKEKRLISEFCRKVFCFFNYAGPRQIKNPAEILNTTYLGQLEPQHLLPGKIDFSEVNYVFGKRYEPGLDDLENKII